MYVLALSSHRLLDIFIFSLIGKSNSAKLRHTNIKSTTGFSTVYSASCSLFLFTQVNWGSSAQAYAFVQALHYTHRLDGIGHHVKNFRPHCLVLTGHPHDRPNLIYLVSQITKNVSLMVYANVIKEAFGMLPEDESDVEWMRKHKIRAFRAVTAGKQCTAELLKSCLLFQIFFFFFKFRRCISVFALTNARKVSFRNSLWWPTYRIFNSVGKTNLFYISCSLHMFCCFPFSCDSLYIPKLYTFCLFEDMFNEWQMVTFVCRGLHFRALFTKHKRQIND